ncbi:MAG: hypothetical protein J6Y33_03045 [Prevotella sp.]|nr:hypothetical protein [Prevotella sp.]
MHRKIYPATLAMAMAMARGRDPYFDVINPMMTEAQKRRREEMLRERAHRLNPVDLSEREFVIKGERIMAHDRKTALKIYANRHPETKKKRRRS